MGCWGGPCWAQGPGVGGGGKSYPRPIHELRRRKARDPGDGVTSSPSRGTFDAGRIRVVCGVVCGQDGAGAMPCSPCPPSIGAPADITASGLISHPAAASRFLSNLCAAGQLLSARGQAGKAVQLGFHVGLQPPRVWPSPHWAAGHPLPQHPGGSGPPIPCLPPPSLRCSGMPAHVPLPVYATGNPAVAHHSVRNHHAAAPGTPRGPGSPASPAPQVSPCSLARVTLGARSSAAAQCWMQTSVPATPVALVLPMHLMPPPSWPFWAVSWAEMSPTPVQPSPGLTGDSPLVSRCSGSSSSHLLRAG